MVASKDGHLYTFKSHENLEPADATESIGFSTIRRVDIAAANDANMHNNAFFVISVDSQNRESTMLMHTGESHEHLVTWLNHLNALINGRYNLFLT